MKRLTARDKYGNAYFPCENCDRYADSCIGGVFSDCIMELAERLAMYEDAEEQGRLILTSDEQRLSNSVVTIK